MYPLFKSIIAVAALSFIQNASAMNITLKNELSDSGTLDITIKNYIPNGSPWCGSQSFYSTSIAMPGRSQVNYQLTKQNFPHNAEHFCVEFKIGKYKIDAIVSDSMIDACQMNVKQFMGYIPSGPVMLPWPTFSINDGHSCFY